MHKYLIIFIEGELISEEGLEKPHRFDGDFEDKRGKFLQELV
jgi:hypothetical protein